MTNDIIHSALVTILKSKRSKMTPAQRRQRSKPTRWLYPDATERHYAAAIRAWLRPMKEYVHSYIKEHSEAILRGDSANLAIRQDATAGNSFNVMVQSLNAWAGAYISDDPEKKLESPIYTGLGNIADSVFKFNEGQYEKSAKAALGIEFPVGEDWWPGARQRWIDQNYTYLKGYAGNYISQVENLTEQAVTSGWSLTALSKKIAAEDSKLEQWKVNRLARDQIGKLNGKISQARMESAGLSMYIWSTSGDERVRPSHALMDGKLCRWDNGLLYSDDGGKTWISRPVGAFLGHPGDDYQCRCTSLAFWDEIVDEADADLSKERFPMIPAQKQIAISKPQVSAVSPSKQEIEDRYIKMLMKNRVANEQDAVKLGKEILQATGKNGDVFETMRKYRTFGTTDAHEFIKGSSKAGKDRVKAACEYYPEKWVKLSLKDAKKNGLKVAKADRGFYSHKWAWDKTNKRYVAQVTLSDRQDCEIHEMAHRMEHLNPRIVELEKEFYERRTKGETLVKIKYLPGYGGKGYGPKEETRIDKFAHPYMGKDYGGDAWEIMSMGVENLHNKVYNTDDDFNAFIVGVLMGA
jgi:SPP1 gp7 family putative phage head morphogenesis protein